MKNLILWELMKIFRNRMYCILIVLVILFPLLYLSVHQWIDTHTDMQYENARINSAQGIVLQDDLRRELSGTIDQNWIMKTEKILNKYNDEKTSQNDIRYQTVSDAYWDGLHTIQKWDYMKHDKLTPKQASLYLQNHEPQYGPYEGWKTSIDACKYSGTFLLLVSIIIFSNFINQEEAAGIMDLLKSSRRGRTGLMTAKLIASLMVMTGMFLMMSAVLTSGCFTLLKMDGGDTTGLVLRGMQFYSFSEIYLQALAIILLGGIATVLFALFCSAIITKPMFSLCAGFLYYLLPGMLNIEFMQTSWSGFFPSELLQFYNNKQLLITPWVQIRDQILPRVPAVGILWLLLGVLMIAGIYWSHCHTVSLSVQIGKRR